jgi:hypothetical protein
MSGLYKVKVSESDWQVWASTVNGEVLVNSFETEEEADNRVKGMKKFSVLITTSFDGYVDIEASTTKEAIDKAWAMVESGEINALDFEPFTEIHYAEEIK